MPKHHKPVYLLFKHTILNTVPLSAHEMFKCLMKGIKMADRNVHVFVTSRKNKPWVAFLTSVVVKNYVDSQRLFPHTIFQ